MRILEYLITTFATYGYFAVFFVLIICGFGIPIPEDITLVAGGVISGLGYTNVHFMLAIGFAGVLIGDGLVFTMGYTLGERALKNHLLSRMLSPERYAVIQKRFENNGKWVVFFGRFMPGLRTPLFLMAGVTKRVRPSLFFITDGLAALISVPIWVYLGYFGAHNLEWILKWVHRGQRSILIALGCLVVLGLILFLTRKKSARHIRDLR